MTTTTITTKTEGGLMSKRSFGRLSFLLLQAWHATMAGGFLVAYLTADEDTYAMHLFAGYVVLAAIVLRLVVGLVAPAGNPWRLPRPSLAGTLAWLRTRRGRNPLFAWMAVALLGGIGLSAASGAIADSVTFVEDFHEGVSEAALWIIFSHIAVVIALYNGRRVTNWLLGRVRMAKETVR